MNNANDINSFFIVIPNGLEEICRQELLEINCLKSLDSNSKLMIQNISVVSGGIEFDATLIDGLMLNYYLKSATRVILRIVTFKCRDFPSLFKKSSKIRWHKYFVTNNCKFSVSSRESRLIHSGRISETLQKAIETFFKDQPPSVKFLSKGLIPKEFAPTVYVKIEHDEVTLSIDTSGERLNVRNIRQCVERAPIRENIAYALLRALVTAANDKSNNLANAILYDPMCGSGTFLFEALLYNSLNDQRDFAFLFFPIVLEAYKDKSYKIHENLLQSLHQIKTKKNQQCQAKVNQFFKIIGNDIDKKAIETVSANCKRASTPIGNIDTCSMDFFKQAQDFVVPLGEKKNIFLILNPPYGKRIKIDIGESSSNDFFCKIIEHIAYKIRPEISGIILPMNSFVLQRFFQDYKILDFIKVKKIISFYNGGISCSFIIFTQ